ncbi:MAG: methylenetetrahydrofolate reductase C-terminal domain-containing protein [Candidatus Altiarchaeota archaeon]
MALKEKVAGYDVEKECAKRMLNGPCGGVQDGMCEVEGPCVWVKVYARLRADGKLEEFRKVRMPNPR